MFDSILKIILLASSPQVLVSAVDIPSWDLWPLFTPVFGVGNFNESACYKASMNYIKLLNESLPIIAGDPLGVSWDEEHKNALKMFDSNGPLPFLQEGMLKDYPLPIDICDFFAPATADASANAECKKRIPDILRYVLIPYGNANGPGSENQCKHLPNAKYCNNVIAPFFYAPPPTQEQTMKSDNPFFQGPKNLDKFKNDIPKLQFKEIDGVAYDYGDIADPSANIDPKALMKLSDYFLEHNIYAKNFHSSLVEILTKTDIFQPLDDPEIGINDVLNAYSSLMLYIWWAVNNMNGAGMWPFIPPFSYHGVCYPKECSKEEIETNNVIFANYHFEALRKLADQADIFIPIIASSPRVPESYGIWLQVTPEQKKIAQTSWPGCSDDEKYSGHWKTENFVVVTLVSLIGFLISCGTLMELLERAPYIKKSQLDNVKTNHGLGYKMMLSFSLISNLEFIFQSSKKGSGQRLDCLEGMRAISMTWVILGHNFIFGTQWLHYRNKMFINQIWMKEVGGISLEAIKQGEFSVDSFLFIGSTLLSFLLLKDLDKSNGWFHGKGIIRMILFYVNRFLRITIPYALVIGVYVGLLPLMVVNPMRAHSMAQSEADSCKVYWWRHLTYSNIFGGENDGCMGQTWYLSFDMIWFCLSPLVVYPLWRTKYGLFHKILGISWWFILMGTSIAASTWYAYNQDYWNTELAPENNLPSWAFSPWGYRSYCYLIGILTGYILYVTKDIKLNLDSKLNIIIWQIVFLIAFGVVYGPWWIDQNNEGQVKSYLILHKLGWGICLSWVTFACVKGYGGFINDFLSWGLWIPISKVSFMTYLFHMSANFYYFAAQGYNQDVSLWLFTEIFVSQLLLCLMYGLIGCLTLELPFGKIQKLIIGQIVKK